MKLVGFYFWHDTVLMGMYAGLIYRETKIAGARGPQHYVWQTLHFWQQRRETLW